ncbi:MAG: IS66 family transposase [Balneolales bacterium]
MRREQEAVRKEQEAVRRGQFQVMHLEARIEQLQRLVYGQKRERFENKSNQVPLPFEAPAEQEQKREAEHQEQITCTCKKQSRPAHKGRAPLPDHLPVEEVEIYPEGNLEGQVCIGKEVTDELEHKPARFYIKRYIRYKYAFPNGQGVQIGELPERVIDKGIPGAGLLATILVDKYVDHLPLYRQRQRFLRENIPIAASTLDGWAAQGMDRLAILYEHLAWKTKTQGYLQADETPIKVIEKTRKGSCHQGYYWVYNNPVSDTVLFDYQPTRGAAGARGMLEGFKGYLQTDGYGVYDKIGAREGVTHLGCWAHARRKFDEALNNDRPRAETALAYIQALYAVERKATEGNLTASQRKELRLEKALPVLNAMSNWISKQAMQVLPKSQIGKALLYSAARWEQLSAYLYDGTLEIDNNLVENAIRPVALGRKNYLFAGSHKAARKAAMIYSFFAMCKKHGVNEHRWLEHTLKNIMVTKYNDLESLLPQNFSSKM